MMRETLIHMNGWLSKSWKGKKVIEDWYSEFSVLPWEQRVCTFGIKTRTKLVMVAAQGSNHPRHFSLPSVFCHPIKSGTQKLHICFATSQSSYSCLEITHWNIRDNGETFGQQRFSLLPLGGLFFHESLCFSIFVCFLNALQLSCISPQHLCKHCC